MTSPQKPASVPTVFPVFYGWLQKKDDKALIPQWKKCFCVLTSDGALNAYSVWKEAFNALLLP